MNRVTLAPVYPIVDSAAWVARLVPLGVRLIQLRIKDQAPERLRAEIRTAQAICRAAGAQLVVNDYWQLALEQGCDYVHLGQGDLDGADLAALRRAGVRLGVSSHDPAELQRALGAHPDYIALGPIYPTLLKQMPWPPQGLPRIGEWKRRLGPIPLVAIGGLTLERLPGVFAAGADCAAVVTDIVRHPEPEQRMRAWLAAGAALSAGASARAARRAAVLVIAATDSSGGAGITRDVETLTELGTPARCAVTAVTVQTDAQLRAIQTLPPQVVRAQIDAALEGGGVGAIKIGMLGSAAAVQAVVDGLPPRESIPIVLDPVLAATSGAALLDPAGLALLLRGLVPRVTLLTPNLPEAAALLGTRAAQTDAARLAQLHALLALGPSAVLLKGGHAFDAMDTHAADAHGPPADAGRVEDLLLMADGTLLRLQTARVHSSRRGTGCSASSAIAAQLAAGRSLAEACAAAQAYVAEALRRQSAAELPRPGSA